MNDKVEDLLKLKEEFLLALDDYGEYWDGIYMSEKNMADKYISQFLTWVQNKKMEVNND